MAALGPFEPKPHIAVGVSGGGDSMALIILAERWARAMGGQVTALVVNHGLREHSEVEAARVGGWLAERDICYVVLEWWGKKPKSGIQGAARDARYRLMEQWCADNHVLHLFVGHTRDDQSETLLMRLQRGSGPEGLAAMSAQRELRRCRLLRPLLDVPREELRKFLREQGQEWLEDPSNYDPQFSRTQARAALGGDGLRAKELAQSARRYGLARIVLERETDCLLARATRFFEGGYAYVDRKVMAAAPEDIALRALSRVIVAVGGLIHAPVRARVERVHSELLAAKTAAMTLGHCQLRVNSTRVEIYRERRNLPAPRAFQAGVSLMWDGRFEIGFGKRPPGLTGSLYLRSLETLDWRKIRSECLELRCRSTVPSAALAGLPALCDDSGILTVPHVKYVRGAGWPAKRHGRGIIKARFMPLRAASDAGFCIA